MRITFLRRHIQELQTFKYGPVFGPACMCYCYLHTQVQNSFCLCDFYWRGPRHKGTVCEEEVSPIWEKSGKGTLKFLKLKMATFGAP